MDDMVILDETEGYSPKAGFFKDLNLEGCFPVTNQREVISSSHTILVEPRAFQQIAEHIDWNKRTQRNVNEQGGILLGQVLKIGNEVIGVAREAIPGLQGKGNSVHLELGFEAWSEMLHKANERCKQSQELNIIGWYHTHPNQLDVFFSGTDRDAQQRYFHEDWQFGIVFNPHRKIWCGFHGESSLPSNGYIRSDLLAGKPNMQNNQTDNQASAMYPSSASPQVIVQPASKSGLPEMLAGILIAVSVGVGVGFLALSWSRENTLEKINLLDFKMHQASNELKRLSVGVNTLDSAAAKTDNRISNFETDLSRIDASVRTVEKDVNQLTDETQSQFSLIEEEVNALKAIEAEWKTFQSQESEEAIVRTFLFEDSLKELKTSDLEPTSNFNIGVEPTADVNAESVADVVVQPADAVPGSNAKQQADEESVDEKKVETKSDSTNVNTPE